MKTVSDINPLISIIIPTYNRGHIIGLALQSVIEQTYNNWEALVVDNYSIDNTEDIVNNFNDPRIRMLKINNNGVIAASRNLGIKKSSGEYIAFLDSDDWWLPNKLMEALQHLKTGFDLVYHDMFIVKNIQRLYFAKRSRGRILSRPIFKDLLLGSNPIMNSSVIVKKCILQEIDYIPEKLEFIGMEDYITWLCISKKTEKFGKILNVLGCYYIGNDNISTPEKMIGKIDELREYYKEDIYRFDMVNRVLWMNYAKGRSYYKMCEYINANNELVPVIYGGNVSVMLKMKALWMILCGMILYNFKKIIKNLRKYKIII